MRISLLQNPVNDAVTAVMNVSSVVKKCYRFAGIAESAELRALDNKL